MSVCDFSHRTNVKLLWGIDLVNAVKVDALNKEILYDVFRDEVNNL